MVDAPSDPLLSAISQALHSAPPGPIALAVSGGSDSVAMLALIAELGTERVVRAVTVDHGLRPEAAVECAHVAKLCARFGLSHDVLHWAGRDAHGNIQAAARAARYRLIGAWAEGHGIGAVFLAHTRDDQAETVLMRLARGSGVDGLAGMSAAFARGGITWMRPLLIQRREELRGWLRSRGIRWCEDPSNEDLRFDRVRVRRALLDEQAFGLSVERLVATADHMRRARDVLDRVETDLARKALTWADTGEATVERAAFSSAMEETRARLLADLLCAVSGSEYRPRFQALNALLDVIVSDREVATTTLHGCIVSVTFGSLAIRREDAAMAPSQPAHAASLWDGRWRITLGDGVPRDAVIGAAGEAARGRDPAFSTTPALWRDDACMAAPCLEPSPLMKAKYEICDTRRRAVLMSR